MDVPDGMTADQSDAGPRKRPQRSGRSRKDGGRHGTGAARGGGARGEPAISDAGDPHPRLSLYPTISSRTAGRWETPEAWRTWNADAPSHEDLCWDTHVVLKDLDAGPTKAWLVLNRAREDVRPLFEIAIGKRPLEELYDLRIDPDHMNNVADDPAYADTRQELAGRLEAVLKENDDPRVVESPCRFELPPFAGPPEWQTQKPHIPPWRLASMRRIRRQATVARTDALAPRAVVPDRRSTAT